jgi:hypothetical protein
MMVFNRHFYCQGQIFLADFIGDTILVVDKKCWLSVTQSSPLTLIANHTARDPPLQPIERNNTHRDRNYAVGVERG